MLGPRIGKYDKNGKARPILGHNILIGALGVFILWFGSVSYTHLDVYKRQELHLVPAWFRLI